MNRVALLLALFAVTGCVDAEKAEPSAGVWAVIDIEPSLLARLDRIELETRKSKASVALHGAAAHELPLIVNLAYSEDRTRDVLQISGFEQGARQALVQRSASLTLVPDKRLILNILLTETCAALREQCEDRGLTCVDCTGMCEPIDISSETLTEVDVAVNPRSVHAPVSCTKGKVDERDASYDTEIDAISTSDEDMSGESIGADASVESENMPPITSDAGTTDGAMITPTPDQNTTDTNTTEPKAPSLLDDCVLLLHLDETSLRGAPQEVIDASGFSNHGTATIPGANAVTEGRFGGAASFDGEGFISVGDAPSLRPTTALSYSAWFYLDELPTNWPGIISKRAGFGDRSAFTMFLSPDDPQTPDSDVHLFADIAGEESRVQSRATISKGEWHHALVVYDGSLHVDLRVRIYIDGKLDIIAKEESSSIPDFTPDLLIGNLINGGDKLKGRVDEVAVWKRALTEDEIHKVSASAL